MEKELKPLDLAYLKTLEVTYEEWDPEPEEDEEDAYYTEFITVGDNFSDSELEEAMKKFDYDYLVEECDTQDEMYGFFLQEMLSECRPGEMKSIEVKDPVTDKVLYERN